MSNSDDPAVKVNVKMQDTDRCQPFSLPKYTVRGRNGEIHQTDDARDLHYLGYIAADSRPSPGGGMTFSFGYTPEESQPSGACNLGRVQPKLEIVAEVEEEKLPLVADGKR